MTLAHAGSGVAASYGTDWLYLVVPLLIMAGVFVYLVATGARGEPKAIGMIPRAAASLERVTEMPAWAAGGIAVGGAALVIAVIGFLWDVAWHIDFGRDEYLFTPAHTMIVSGLLLLVGAAIVATVLATVTRASVGATVKGIRIPYSALALGLLGMGAVTGFPLDELWHGAYGVDVTMWGPTHLLMIGGASFCPIALMLMITEAEGKNPSRSAQLQRVLLGGAVVIGLSTLQGEFDFGVPQFQQLYHPVLIALAASMGLIAVRELLGRWGAIKAVAFFLVARLGLAVLIGQALNHVIPRFPLYIGAALLVEAVWHWGREASPVKRAVIAGLLIGTVGLAVEWLWTLVWGWHPWNATLFPGIAIATAIAVPGALIGLAMGRGFAGEAPVTTRSLLVASGVAVVLLLALPFPRHDVDATAVVSTESVGDGVVHVDVQVDPAIGDTDWAEVLAWQGGHMDAVPLEETDRGTYSSVKPVPVGGEWKTLVRFARKDVLVAAPVFLPKDTAIGASEVPVVPQREVNLVRDTELLLRESKEGPTWPALVAYGGIAAVALTWLFALVFAFLRINSDTGIGSRKATDSASVDKRRAPSVADPSSPAL